MAEDYYNYSYFVFFPFFSPRNRTKCSKNQKKKSKNVIHVRCICKSKRPGETQMRGDHQVQNASQQAVLHCMSEVLEVEPCLHSHLLWIGQAIHMKWPAQTVDTVSCRVQATKLPRQIPSHRDYVLFRRKTPPRHAITMWRMSGGKKNTCNPVPGKQWLQKESLSSVKRLLAKYKRKKAWILHTPSLLHTEKEFPVIQPAVVVGVPVNLAVPTKVSVIFTTII